MTTLYRRSGQALAEAGAALGPSESHALACGVYCVRRDLDAAQWVDAVFVERADEEAARAALAPLGEAVGASIAALSAGEFGFEPLLPDDDAPLRDRVEALARWCTGFLAGLGLAGLDPGGLGPDAREFLDDLRHLARTAPGDESPDASEAHYAELVEYVRVGVMHVDADLGRA